jgi:hypothetical protein
VTKAATSYEIVNFSKKILDKKSPWDYKKSQGLLGSKVQDFLGQAKKARRPSKLFFIHLSFSDVKQ